MAAKSPEVTIKFKDLDNVLRRANPFFEIIPIKVSTDFPSLTPEEKLDLEELANMEDGKAERWLLVPDSIPLYTLGVVISKAFGLTPDPSGSAFSFTNEEWEKYVPDMDRFIDLSGSVFDNPPDILYANAASNLCMASELWYPPVPVALLVPPSTSFKESRAAMEDAFSDLRKNGVEKDGRILSLEELPANLDDVAGKIKNAEEMAISDGFCPDLELRCVLQEEGRKLYSMDEQKKDRRPNASAYKRIKAKPFVDKMCMYTFDQDGYVAYEFTITRPKNVYPLIEEGFLSLEEYIESCSYVASNMVPDCIYKGGYDLFGPDPIFYHDFIMAIHGPEREEYLKEAQAIRWKEPYMDLKKVLR